MAKFASILILVGVIITVQALPPTYDEIIAAARENQWDQVQQLLRNNFAKTTDFKGQPAVFDGVRNLKPVDGGHVYGEAEYSFHSASNVGGKTTEDHAGHKVINDDGKVKEFDFTPKTDLSPVLHSIKPQSQFGNDYSASDYSFQYAPSNDQGTPGGFNKQPVLTPNQPTNNQFFGNLVGQTQGGLGIQGGQGTLGGHPGTLGGQSHHNSYNHKYSYSHSHSYVDGKPVEGGLFNGGKPVISPFSFTDIKDLKPSQGGQVFGEAQFQYHTSSNVDGQVSEDQGGHKVINNNGQVQEFDLTPVPNKSPVVNYSYN